MTLYYRIDEPGDVRDIGDQIAEWLADGNPKAAAWASQPPQPSPEAVWEGGQWVMPVPEVPSSVTARQIRLWLVANGTSLAAVDAAINQIPDDAGRDRVRVEWEYAPTIDRAHPMLSQIAAGLGLSAAVLDQAFREASVL